MMKEQGLDNTTVLIGGAPVSDRHAAYVAMAGADDIRALRDNVFYCATAMDGVNIMNQWVGAKDHAALLDKNRSKLLLHYERAQKLSEEKDKLLHKLPRRTVSFNGELLPDHPWFRRETFKYSLRQLAPYLDTKTLFALNWKFGGKSKRERQGASPESLHALFEEWIRKADKHHWISPSGLAGIYPCQSEDESVIVYDPDDLNRELCRFSFTTVVGSEKKDIVSAAQYFRPKSSGQYDAIGVQITTSGPQIDEQLEAYRGEGDSESSLYLQGLSDRVAEDLADHVHNTLRERIGFDKKRGTRWSPGYAAMPDTDNNRIIQELLDAKSAIGVTVTDAGEFAPTGTTAAVVCFHPDARYT
jgi:5-methyltetrahydrofolate--homocysteine methyltransferase